MTDITAGTLPWYRSLTASQWRTLFAANLGWLFDGYEAYALFLTVGPAMHSLLDPVAISANPRLCRHGGGDHAARLGHRRLLRRHPRRLHRPQAHDDLRHPRLFAADRADRAVVQLDFVCAAALLGRHRHRLGMGDRLVHDGRAVAAERARQRRRPHAMRPRHRFLPGLVHLAVRQRASGRRPGATCSSSAFCRRC